MPIRRIDLNLLGVFDAVMQCRSVSEAARRLNVTPSAVSHTLARLRHVFGDELFIAGDIGMQPTRRALELAGPIRKGLAHIEAGIGAVPFDPASAARTFCIAASDYTSVTVLPELVARMMQVAPA